MKAVILAGGLGTRISEESHLRPKPMIEIGGQPILWHILKLYSHYGINQFVICCGYKQEVIKRYFFDYFLYHADVTFNLPHNEMKVHQSTSEPWEVTLVDTGIYTMTGSRIKKIRSFIGDEPFMLTYGDGVSDVNLQTLLEFHKQQGKLATLTAVQPEGRFGILNMENDTVLEFHEKHKADMGWINAGFMVLEPQVFDYIPDGDDITFEETPLAKLASDAQLNAYRHTGFWQCMDTQRDMKKLESLWQSQSAPWKVW